jgi:hypothetical protein
VKTAQRSAAFNEAPSVGPLGVGPHPWRLPWQHKLDSITINNVRRARGRAATTVKALPSFSPCVVTSMQAMCDEGMASQRERELEGGSPLIHHHSSPSSSLSHPPLSLRLSKPKQNSTFFPLPIMAKGKAKGKPSKSPSPKSSVRVTLTALPTKSGSLNYQSP